jgi:hypothetical protein
LCNCTVVQSVPGVSFPGVKRPGRGADHTPEPSAIAKERVELYLYSHSILSWRVIDWSVFIVETVFSVRYESEFRKRVFMNFMFQAMKWAMWLVTGLSSRRPGFFPAPVYIDFAVGKIALGRVLLQVIRFSAVSFNLCCIHLFISAQIVQERQSKPRNLRKAALFQKYHRI